jgi:hypothetical protein
MDELSNSVYEYYVAHFNELTESKQLHFASRLALWSADPFAIRTLGTMRPMVTHNEDPAAALQAVYAEAQATIHHGSKNAAELRAPYFGRYPQLRGIATVLFRLTFLKTIYSLDARAALFEIFPKDQLDEFFRQLIIDREAVSILSTHAVNVLYLYSRIVLEDDSLFDPKVFLEVGAQHYDMSRPLHLQLYIYLYTHCIIGESKFYARKVPERYLATYQQMLDELELCISQNFEGINLDNKFEYLVCCKLIGKKSQLESRIAQEAKDSVSPDGTFLIDVLNKNPQTANSTLDLSEHRNVLFIMANREPSGLHA